MHNNSHTETNKGRANAETWLPTAAAQVRAWREEDRANGIIWNDEIQREDGLAKAPVNNQ